MIRDRSVVLNRLLGLLGSPVPVHEVALKASFLADFLLQLQVELGTMVAQLSDDALDRIVRLCL